MRPIPRADVAIFMDYLPQVAILLNANVFVL